MPLVLNMDLPNNTTAHVEFRDDMLEKVGARFYCQSLDVPHRRLLLGTILGPNQFELCDWAFDSVYNMIKDEVDDNGQINVEFGAIDEESGVYRTWSNQPAFPPTDLHQNANGAGDEVESSDSDPCPEPTSQPSADRS